MPSLMTSVCGLPIALLAVVLAFCVGHVASVRPSLPYQKPLGSSSSSSSGNGQLTQLWSVTLPNTTVPLVANVTPGWAVLNEDYFVYATTLADGTLILLNATTGATWWTFNDWRDNVPAEQFTQRTILFTSSTVFVLRGSVLHALDLMTGAPRYRTNISVVVPLVEVVAVNDEVLLLQFGNETYGVVSAVNPSDAAMLWSREILSGSNLRTDASAIAIQAYHSGSGNVSVEVLRPIDGVVMYRDSFALSQVQFLYLMAVHATSVVYLLQQETQSVIRAVFGPGVQSVTPFAFFVETTIWGYGIAGDFLYLQVGDDSIQVLSYNFTTGDPVAASGQTGAASRQGHIVGEPEFAILAFTNATDYILTGWNGENGNIRFDFAFNDISSAISGKGHTSEMVALRSKKGTPTLRNTVVYNLVANYQGQMVLPTEAGGLYFVDGTTATLDRSYTISFPNLLLQSIAIDSQILILTFGSSAAALTWV